eukprot:NODE_1289_length_1009_cov_138.980208_g896_i0.p2 GENE.NODE_1289_length_1009_cov_138.980208_g896_i0~~NODE_1289_length_1009_cov_138.980208_g896_i0.p2  ORF type:complete len:113 (-),score=11.08 NODE_1289_length_1009_cov_138.980208_g896_i0:669-968(-)
MGAVFVSFCVSALFFSFNLTPHACFRVAYIYTCTRIRPYMRICVFLHIFFCVPVYLYPHTYIYIYMYLFLHTAKILNADAVFIACPKICLTVHARVSVG